MSQASNRPTKRAAGCVVYCYDGAAPLILLIHDQYGRWTLPKGHLKPGESEAAAAAREVLEETAIAGELGPLVGRITYAVVKNGQPRQKEVAFFLLRADGGRAQPQADEGIRAAEWFAPAAALALAGYPQVREMLARAIDLMRPA